MEIQGFRKFTEEEQETWSLLYNNLDRSRKDQIVPMFHEGLDFLGITADRIPNLDEVNQRLKKETGWQGVPVEGLEEGVSFYPALAEKTFPIGNFIRDRQDLSYTPAPDIFHDLYGHIPFFVNKDYARFCEEYGKTARQYVNEPGKLRMFERLFWFTCEFGLTQTDSGTRIFGAGIVSSVDECDYSLSDKPTIIDFDLEKLALQEFRIDVLQERLFLLESPDQLYGCLKEFEAKVNELFAKSA